MILSTWAAKWGVSDTALAELRAAMLGDTGVPTVNAKPSSEAAVQNNIRLAAGHRGGRLFRNNVGVLKDDRGIPVRFGLANDSAALNAAMKSSDLIGILPVTITLAHVGHTIGQFWSVECKRPGWRYKGEARETAQLAWIEQITALGGRAHFSTGDI